MEYAVNLAAAALIVIADLALTYGAVQATYVQAELSLNDTSRAPVLCAGPVRQSPTGGSC